MSRRRAVPPSNLSPNQACAKPAPAPSRRLTELEFDYARAYWRTLQWKRWMTIGFGAFFLLIGAMLMISLFTDDHMKSEPAALLCLLWFVPLFIAFSIYMLKVTLRRRDRLADSTCVLQGTMAEKVTRLANPRTGTVSRCESYWIGDTRLVWPKFAETIYSKYVDQPIQVTAALITGEGSTKPILGMPADYDAAKIAVVLEMEGVLHIDRALRKYGRAFIRRHSLLSAIGLCIVGGQWAAMMFWMMEACPWAAKFTLGVILTMLALSIALVAANLALAWGCKKLYGNLSGKGCGVSFEEKLRG